MISTRENKVIVVLGMHRSGTSAITRGLRVMGVGLGDKMMPPVEGNNPKGFWEDIDLNALNVEMLSVIASDWYHVSAINPIDVEVLRQRGYLNRAVEVLQQKVSSAAPVFGFKDPRVAKLLPFWKEVFSNCQLDVSYLLALRNPLSVVKSLGKRDGVEAEQSYLMWLGHVVTSLIGSAGDKRVLVDYDRLMEDPDRELMRVAKCTGLEIDPIALQSYKSEFLDKGLRHTFYERKDLLSDDTCPPIVLEVYTVLLDVASEKANLDDKKLKDKVMLWSDEFERLRSPLLLIDKLLERQRAATQAVCDRDGQIDNLNQTVCDRDGQIDNLNQTVCDRDGQIYKLNQAVSERDVQIANLDRQLANLVGTVEEIYRSNSWRLLAPLRFYGRQRQKMRRLRRALPAVLGRAGGMLPLMRFSIKVWRQDGVQGVRALLSQEVIKENGSENIRAKSSLPAGELQDQVATDSRPTEILFVAHEASRTGAPVFLLDLARLLKDQLNISCVFLLRNGGELEEQFQKLGPTFRLANSHMLDPLTISALKKRNIALVYSNTGTNGFIQHHLKELGCQIICHVHELGFSLERHFGEENFKALLATTDLFLAGSGAVADYLIGHRRISPDKVNVAYPFIDLAANRRCLAHKVPPLDIPTAAVVVGSCGIISWRKGTDLFVQMARLVLEQASRPVHFVWLGGPLAHGEYQNVRYDAEMSGIADHLTFPGSVTDHLSYFKQFDIFALTSREDPFPLVVLDAASLGLPVVCFEQAGGAPEFIEEDAGLVVPYLDVERMAAAIVRLVEDAGLRRQFGDVGRAKVLARHDIKVGGRHLVEIVRSCLASSEQEET